MERLVAPEAGAHRLEDRRTGPDLRVAVHARLRRRDVRERRLFHGGVAVAAVDTHRPDVMRVAALKWLVAGVGPPRDVPGPGDRDHPPSEKGHEDQRRDDADLGPDVGAASENLTHRSEAP